jgi:hypothetical protein
MNVSLLCAASVSGESAISAPLRGIRNPPHAAGAGVSFHVCDRAGKTGYFYRHEA